jgi:hypothetical protein
VTIAIDIKRETGRLLSLDRKAADVSFSKAIGHLLEELEGRETRKRKRKDGDRAKLKDTLEAVVADLYSAYLHDPAWALGYSRNGNDYNGPKRYRSAVGSLTSVVTVADFLTGAGYVDSKTGYYRRAHNASDAWGNGGERSRIRATRKLISLLQDTFGVRPEHIERRDRDGELVRLKDTKGALVDYTDNAHTIAMRRQLETLNKTLEAARIDLGDYAADELPDVSAKSLYRIFNDGRFDRGGRFYGGWWISAKSEVRSHILIDGEATVELDYSALHPWLCYHLSGIADVPQGDLYNVRGLEGARRAIKWAFVVMLNLAPGQRMPVASDKVKKQLPAKWTVGKLRKALVAHYAVIAEWLGAGRGTELQYIDSQIASEVLRNMDSSGVVCLPVHDSFIVAKKHEGILRLVMESAYTKVLHSHNSDLVGTPAIVSNK